MISKRDQTLESEKYFRDVKELINDFEDLLLAYGGQSSNSEKRRKIKAIGVCFRPCAKNLVIIRSDIFLK